MGFSTIKEWHKRIVISILEIPPKYLSIFFGILSIHLIVRVYYIVSLPISYDEAWTYLNFTQRGIFSSMSYYPTPNNHILHSLLTNFTSILPFSETSNLRVPNLLANTLVLSIFFLTFRKLLENEISLFLCILLSFLFPMLYYGYCSRGYSLLALGFLICFYACIQLLQSDHKTLENRYLVYFFIGGLLGFYTMPSFLYPYITLFSFLLFVFVFRGESASVKKWVLTSMITAIFVILLYVPIFLISGLEAVIDNPYVQSISRTVVLANLWSHFSDVSLFLFCLPLPVFLIGLLVSIGFFSKLKKASLAIALSFFTIFICPFILLGHAVLPYPRTWIYLLIPVLYLLGVCLIQLEVKQKRMLLLFLGIFIGGSSLLHFHHQIPQKEKFAFEAETLAHFFIEQKPQQVYCHHPLVETNLRYLFIEHQSDIEVVYSNVLPIEADRQRMNGCDFLVFSERLEEVEGLRFLGNFGENLFVFERY